MLSPEFLLVCSDILLVCKNIPVWKENTKQKPWHHKHEPLSQECNRPAIWPNFKRINVLSSNFNSNFYKLICKKKNSNIFLHVLLPSLLILFTNQFQVKTVILLYYSDWQIDIIFLDIDCGTNPGRLGRSSLITVEERRQKTNLLITWVRITSTYNSCSTGILCSRALAPWKATKQSAMTKVMHAWK